MAAKKFLRLVAGRVTEIIATIVSAGAGNDGDLVALDATGKLDLSVLPAGVGPATVSVVASENLAAGDFVNIWNDGGTPKVRKADATTNGKPANGFVLAGFLSGATASVYLDGQNTQVTGKTPGAAQFLSTTPGAVSETAPSASGNLVQVVGYAASATVIGFSTEERATVA